MLFIKFFKSSPLASFQPFPVKQDVLPLPAREMSKIPSLYVFTGRPQHGETWSTSRCTLYNVSVKVKVVAHHVGGRHLLGHVFIYKSRSNNPHPHPSLRGGALASNSLNKFPAREGGDSDYHQGG